MVCKVPEALLGHSRDSQLKKKKKEFWSNKVLKVHEHLEKEKANRPHTQIIKQSEEDFEMSPPGNEHSKHEAMQGYNLKKNQLETWK